MIFFWTRRCCAKPQARDGVDRAGQPALDSGMTEDESIERFAAALGSPALDL